MPRLPLLDQSRTTQSEANDSVVFAVYAPLGSDEILSVYPNAKQASVRNQPLVRALQQVAARGVNVSALVDLFQDNTYLVEIPAGQPKAMCVTSVWKQDMSTPQALAGFLCRVKDRFPCSALVLSIEGHGGAFVPEIDFARLNSDSLTKWSDGTKSGTVTWTKSESDSRFQSDTGSPVLPVNSPELPVNSPELPGGRMVMSTWALGEALRRAIKSGVPRPAVINFANCFNASVEHLHTVAPYADFATGYANYDFFTAGQTYAMVFENLKRAGSASAEQLAQWFAAENGRLLNAKKNHPTVGATVKLSRMKAVATAIDKLALALIAALQPAHRAAMLGLIQQAAQEAQHYDTQPGFELAVPDQFMDLGSFAVRLLAHFPSGTGQPVIDAVRAAASGVKTATAGLRQYGDFDRPYLDENQIWDFRSTDLGLNISFPDPDRQGLWDWRSPYYLAGKVDTTKPPAQRQVINFLADRGGASPPWVAFIKEYHSDVRFVGLRAARPFVFPTFNASFKPKLPHPGDDGNPGGNPDGKKY
jgi:hypothetical protein